MGLKERLLHAIKNGDFGSQTSFGVEFTLKDFTLHFSDVNHRYLRAFLPCATIEPGRTYLTECRYLFRVGYGKYRLHTDALQLLEKK